MKCQLITQGFNIGDCQTRTRGGKSERACEVALRKDVSGTWYRVISSAHLSRPEHYFSIYMSGCNLNCRKCHSHEFTKKIKGEWMSTDQIANLCAEYEKNVTVFEPVERALDYYAHDLCRCCGSCVMLGRQSSRCPGRISPNQVLLGPQGFGPARNIVGYTGGDLACCPDFYIQLTNRIKSKTSKIHVLFETNGYGLTTDNERILELPAKMISLDFQLEVLSLFIPGWVEENQLVSIAHLLAGIDPLIPFTLLAFFPEYHLRDVRPPTVTEMISTYHSVKDAGIINLRIGNIGVFASTDQDLKLLERETGIINCDID
ncbi:MAG: radical SAM protein [Bacteroidales bacterium]|nr:radical SAM protein [Bacteroidales bacterium]